MDTDFTQFKYGEYRRKSSDEDDKQSQSLETQTRENQRAKVPLGLNVVKEWDEQHTAFVPGRPNFAELVAMTERGEINAWLVWHATRLSRNPIDAGRVIYLMDTGKLHHIRTPTRIYHNTSTDKMLLGFELMVSKKDSDDKSNWIKQNIETKSGKGVPHGLAKLGFRNSIYHSKGDGYWLVDEERFPKVQQLFRLFLAGRNSVRQLHTVARDELVLRTPVRKQSGGKPITLARTYKLLGDPIYAGFFHYNGQRYELDNRLPRATSEGEYWSIQTMLGRKGRPKPKKRRALYNHFMRDVDGGGVTPDFKFQLICSGCKHKFSYPNKEQCPKCGQKISGMENPTYLSYVYYYTTREKKAVGIKRKGIEEKKVEASLVDFYDKQLIISHELSRWCVEYLREIAKKDERDQATIGRSLEDAEARVERKLEGLLDLRISKATLTDDEALLFDKKEKALRLELATNREKRQRYKEPSDWLAEAERGFELLPKLIETIERRDFDTKHDALACLGSNLTLTNGKVSIFNAEWVNAFIEGLEIAKSKNPRFEPKNTVDTTGRNDIFVSVRPFLRRGLKNVRTCFLLKQKGDEMAI